MSAGEEPTTAKKGAVRIDQLWFKDLRASASTAYQERGLPWYQRPQSGVEAGRRTDGKKVLGGKDVRGGAKERRGMDREVVRARGRG